MDDLAYLMRRRKDPMRARAYQQAKETIEVLPDAAVTGPEALKGRPGIGPAIYEKLVTLTATGTLPLLEEGADDLRTKRAMEVFTQIYGVGEKKAEELVAQKGVTTLEELTARQYELLNDKQQIGLRYYHDILERIPRDEIDAYYRVFRAAASTACKDVALEIVGSYRRGAGDSGDIDVILTATDPAHFKTFIDTMKAQKIIEEVLSCGNSKCLVIGRLSPAHKARRVDFLYTPPQEYPFAVLYFTGSKGFNTAMREHALSRSYTLNEHGLSVMEGRKKGALVSETLADEAAIFAFLGLAYKTPAERTGGDAVVPAAAAAAQPAITKKRVTRKKAPAAAAPAPTPVVTAPAAAPTPEPAPAPTVVAVPSPSPAVAVTAVPTPTNDLIVSPSPATAPSPTVVPAPVAMDHIHQFQRDGTRALAPLSEPQLAAMIEAANHAFHTVGAPVMTDAEYDILTRYTEERFPTSQALQAVGAVPVAKNKVRLPYEMASMDKIKPDTAALVQWKAKYRGPYVLSSKLDGVSGMYTVDEAGAARLYTRGDGKVGQDITYLIPYLRLPKGNPSFATGIAMRGEFVFKKAVFATKYASTYANARNLVAGLVNGKTVDDRIRDLDFVVYEVIQPANLTPSQQMSWIRDHGFLTVTNRTVPPDQLTNDYLSDVLRDARSNDVYDIDGIIVSDDRVYPRTSGNPDHSFAFKMVLSDQAAETHVVNVEWAASKDGFLKPTVHVEPVTVGGVTIRKATGFNAEFIEKHRLGVGAIVRIIRSGDVIPYIQAVVAPATQAQMPSVPYVWNKTHVDILLEHADDDPAVRKKRIVAFFRTLDVDGLREGNVQKLLQAGYDTICKIVKMSAADMLKVEGVQQKTADKLVTGIRQAVARAPLPALMVASGKMGRGLGEKKLETVFEAYPTWWHPEERNVDRLAAIKGMSRTAAEELVAHLPAFTEFLEECGIAPLDRTTGPVAPTMQLLPAATAVTAAPAPAAIGPEGAAALAGKTLVMTGIRSKELETALKPLGVKFGAAVSKNTFAVITGTKPEDGAKLTGKMKDAQTHGIPIYSLAEFQTKYQINV
jgi:NAD-dependent DNA ligase